MARKPNYRFERFERERTRAAKKAARAQAKADKKKAADGVHSGKALIEIDCKAWTFRYVRTLYYGGRMGRGAYLGGGGEQPPDHIGPDSMVGVLARAVCTGVR